MPIYIFLPYVRLAFVAVWIIFLSSKYFEYHSPRYCTLCSYIQQCVVGDRNKFASCQCEPLIDCSNDEDQTALKWDRSSYPVAAPGCFSHHLRLKYPNNTWIIYLWIRVIISTLVLLNLIHVYNQALNTHDELNIRLTYGSILYGLLWQNYLMCAEL